MGAARREVTQVRRTDLTGWLHIYCPAYVTDVHVEAESEDGWVTVSFIEPCSSS